MSILVDDLCLSIGEKLICEDLNIEFSAGEFWGILGVNGVGKSTLLHHLINCESTDNISIDGIALSDYKQKRKLLAKKTGILLQEYEYNFSCTVMETALIGRHPHMANWQWESDNDITIATQALTTTGLIDFKDRNIDSLSGGEKRRLNIATLLTQDPDYYFLDEPTNHLDLKSQMTVLTMLRNKFSNNDKTGIMVIHDANLAYQYCDNILLLYGNGKWKAGKTHEMINTKNLAEVYDCQFHCIEHQSTQYFIPSQG